MYKHVEGFCRAEIVINKSRFIGSCQCVKTQDEAREFVEKINREFYDATHNCFAYIFDGLGNALKFSDDGEPKGTAGMPILEVIRNKKLVYTCVVVTRYFGGIKLGAGGLVRAYTDGAVAVLDKAKIVEMTEAVGFIVKIDYNIFKPINSFLEKQEGQKTLNIDYADKVLLTCVCKEDLFETIKADLVDMSQGKCEVVEERREFFAF